MENRRINKYLADSGYCSRREADRLVAQGRVRIDGRAAVMGGIVQLNTTLGLSYMLALLIGGGVL